MSFEWWILTRNTFGTNFVHFTASGHHSHGQFVNDQYTPFDVATFGRLLRCFVPNHFVHNLCEREKRVTKNGRGREENNRNWSVELGEEIDPKKIFRVGSRIVQGGSRVVCDGSRILCNGSRNSCTGSNFRWIDHSHVGSRLSQVGSRIPPRWIKNCMFRIKTVTNRIKNSTWWIKNFLCYIKIMSDQTFFVIDQRILERIIKKKSHVGSRISHDQSRFLILDRKFSSSSKK